jgi:hypothetical protein
VIEWRPQDQIRRIFPSLLFYNQPMHGNSLFKRFQALIPSDLEQNVSQRASFISGTRGTV